MSEKDTTLEKLSAWKKESEQIRSSKDSRIAKNLKLFKGIFREEKTTSKVRGDRKKTFFRKICATIWRLTATMYQAFLKDPETFKIEGVDLDDDPRKAKVLQKIVEYRRNKLMSDNSLFLRFIWAIQAIFTNGWVCGKLAWEYEVDKDGNVLKDGPKVMIYPFEQVFPDLAAETEEEMRYICFLNYLTSIDLEEMGIPIPDVQPTAPESNEIRDVRFHGDIDPKNYDNTSVSYTPFSGGNYSNDVSTAKEDDNYVKRYNVYESFWKEKGKIMYGVSLDFEQWLVKPKISKYGDKFPIFTGQCLTEMHKLIGEGFPELLESPQESFNYNLNMRKDNIATAMTGHTFVSRYGGVDLDSLTNRRVNGITLMDDVNAVKHEQMPDVTARAYDEAYADEQMMDDMSGVNKSIEGQQEAGMKATTAQLNQTNSSAKIDLYTAIVGNTLFKGFISELTRQIILFETDEKIFRVANERLRIEEKDPEAYEVYDIEIDADVTINVGPGAIGQGAHIQQIILAMDRAIMAMQAVPALAQMGMIPPQGLDMPNISALYRDLLPYLGLRNVKDYLINLPQPQQPQGAGVGSPPNLGGSAGTGAEMIQQGSLGGV